MVKKIEVFCNKSKVFWLKKPSDILILRNQFRIAGNLIKVSNLNLNFFLFLNLEEFLLGVEMGFLKITSLKKRKHLLSYLVEKFEKNVSLKEKIYRSFKKKNKYFLKKKNNSIKRWREIVDILSQICKFNFKKRIKLKKNTFYHIKPFKIYSYKKKIYFFYKNLQDFLKGFSENDFFKYSVYKNLWQRGFNLSCGIKFGCSFLAYAGNITDVHSYLSVLLIPFNFFFFNPKLVIAFGRIGTITKKFNILVYFDEIFLVRYCSLRWNSYLP